MNHNSKSNFSIQALLPSKSGCLVLSILAIMIGALAYGIFWSLMNVPPGS